MRNYYGPYGGPCKHCGKERSAWRHDDKRQIYCSPECRTAYYQQHNPKILVRCINPSCGKLFKPRRITQKYHDDQCKTAAQNHRWYMRHRAAMKARVTHYRWKIKVGLHKPHHEEK